MDCGHLTTLAEYENKKLQGYKCTVCEKLLPKPDYMKKRKDEKNINLNNENDFVDEILELIQNSDEITQSDMQGILSATYKKYFKK